MTRAEIISACNRRLGDEVVDVRENGVFFRKNSYHVDLLGKYNAVIDDFSIAFDTLHFTLVRNRTRIKRIVSAQEPIDTLISEYFDDAKTQIYIMKLTVISMIRLQKLSEVICTNIYTPILKETGKNPYISQIPTEMIKEWIDDALITQIKNTSPPAPPLLLQLPYSLRPPKTHATIRGT